MGPERCRLCGKRRSHNLISSTGDITMSNFLTKPSTDEEAADTSGLCNEIKDGFLVLPQQMAAASWAIPASEITGTSMGSFLSLSTEDCRNGVTTMNELSLFVVLELLVLMAYASL
ncbi:hypothetical protein EJ110_NYTH45573 [Nymphaea thermarum]|nr:hypothetical protein EJ110_NYTH45573 [Nymphaea thermarum]